MAYVAISQRLKHDINYNIRTMYQQELNSLKEPAHPDITPAMVEQKLWGAHYHLKEQMPASWLQVSDGSGLTIRGVNAEGVTVYSNYAYFQRGALTYPPKCRSGAEFTIAEVPSLIFWDQYYQQRKEVQTRWDTITQSIRDYLDRSKSLNDALKHMEELQYYVPKHYLAKVAEKPEKKGKTESEAKAMAATIDKDALVAGVIAARLAGS